MRQELKRQKIIYGIPMFRSTIRAKEIINVVIGMDLVEVYINGIGFSWNDLKDIGYFRW